MKLSAAAPERVRPTVQRVVDLIADAAAAGQPCPTNDAIAAAMGWPDATSAFKAIRAAERAGVIKVERFMVGRIVTICATGEKTAPPPGKQTPRGRA